MQSKAFTQYQLTENPVLTPKEQRQLARQKRLAEQHEIDLLLKAQTQNLIDRQRFVLEADYLQGHQGQRISVNSGLNFVWIDSTKAILQVGNTTSLGYNGVGGITVEGSISRYELATKENKGMTSYHIQFSVNGTLGYYSVYLWIRENGQAEARITGIQAGSLTYIGEIVPLEKSKVFKAHSY